MTKSLSYSIVGNTLTCLIDGKIYTLIKSNPEFKVICEELNSDNPDKDKIRMMFNKVEGMKNFSQGDLKVQNGLVLYKDAPLHNRMTDKIIECMGEGLPWKPLARFLERLMENPSNRAVETLFEFLQHTHLQITPEGMFIAHKGVAFNYYDIHSGTILNLPGSSPKRLRSNEVDDDPRKGCSYGYHVGSYNYASRWGSKVLRVLVDPKDVRCVPYDCNHQKVRCTFYRVLDEVKEELGETSSPQADWKDYLPDTDKDVVDETPWYTVPSSNDEEDTIDITFRI